ncbi:MAG: ECF-type sigma factor [Planctomycetota bacterium]
MGDTHDPQPRDEVTQLLGRVAEGDRRAVEEVLPLVYAELRSLAESHFRHERANHTLQPTALVHEAFLKLVDQQGVDWSSRRQFFFLASRAMRNILIDHARTKNRAKRGGDRDRVELATDPEGPASTDSLDLLALDEALQELASLDERKARLVELRFFGGLTLDQAAETLEVARSTASEDWRLARAWLRRRLEGPLS